ncbi:MAG: helix-turn-helix transcriptional regulator [Rickettsiales bacterium]|nr:helix-turn-helix transcriptional regulator [Rickettsiales bacterium]
MKKRKPSVYDSRYSELIELLVKARKRKAITQEELSAKLAISRQNISKIELGQRRLDVLELNDWLHALGIKLDILDKVKDALRKT